MSDTPYNFQNQLPPRYNMMNGAPSDNRTGLLNKTMPYNSTMFQQQKNVPPPPSINSNGMSTSSSLHSSRDSSPLPPQMKSNFDFNGSQHSQQTQHQQRTITPPTKNILLSQPQDDSQNILLAASKFQPNTPSLITGNNQFNNTLITNQTSQSNNNIATSDVGPHPGVKPFTLAANTLPQRPFNNHFPNQIRASPVLLEERSPLQSPPHSENKPTFTKPSENNFRPIPISQPSNDLSNSIPSATIPSFSMTPSENIPPPTDFKPPPFHSSNSPLTNKPLAPTSNLGNMPPTSGTKPVANKPLTSTLGNMPPTNNMGHMPPTSSIGNMPPTSNIGNMPPTSSTRSVTPSSNLGNMAPAMKQGHMPPTSSIGNMPPTSNIGSTQLNSNPLISNLTNKSMPPSNPINSNLNMTPNLGSLPNYQKTGVIQNKPSGPSIPSMQNKSLGQMQNTPMPPMQNKMPANNGSMAPTQIKPSGGFNLNPMSSQPPNMFPNTQPLPNYGLPPTRPSPTPPVSGPPTGVSRKYPQNPYPQPMQQPISQQMPPPMPQQQQYGGQAQYQQPAFVQQPQFNQQPPPQLNQQPQFNQYPQQNQYQQPNSTQQGLNQQFNNLNVTQTGFNRLWGGENYDLLVCRNVLPNERVEAPQIHLQPAELNDANCSPDIFRCTVTRIPDTSALLNKSRLPLGVLIHPFKDLNHLPVIQCSTIVRCRACRTYINPFVYFVDQKRWKCNLCYRVNDLPEEFQFDPVTKSYGDPSRRPEVKASTIEYVAPSEYMIRPPQPAVYLFLLDVSSLAIESGYLRILCDTLIQTLDTLPGDARTQIGFLCYNSALHFYSLADGLSQPHEMTIVDVDDIFLPSPDNLLVNLKERKELVKDLLHQLPGRFYQNHDNGSALGAALQAAFKMMSSTGGRVSVFQCALPSVGPGSLVSREVPANRANDDVQHLNPATDFYKRLALECSGHQIAVDLFILNSQYIDLSTISGISRFSAGCIHHWPLFKASKTIEAQQFENCLRRYLTRKIGYEAVMRIRCTRGLAIHTFHGNFFVRSTDLLTLPNCNPDSGFGMQVSIEESLSDLQTVCFQAALLYTSSKGERRIRVHTLCLPIAHTLQEVLNSADQQCIVGLVAKMAVDRSLQSNLSDARDAFINVVVDVLSAYKLSLNQGSVSASLLAPESLKLLPLYIVALLKHVAFRTGTSTRLDDRVYAMCQMKSLPLSYLTQDIYPDLYPIHALTDENGLSTESGRIVPQPPRLQLSAEKLDARGAFLLDCNNYIYIYVGHAVSTEFMNNTLGFEHFSAIPDDCLELPKVDTAENDRLHTFITTLNDNKPYPATIQILRDNSPLRRVFLDKLIEDRIETALSYYEFLQHLKTHVK